MLMRIDTKKACNGRSRGEAAAVDLTLPVNGRVSSNGQLIYGPANRFHHRIDCLMTKGDKFAKAEEHIPILLMTLA